jgi:radical SAM protein with 4Fe4S-binding SPASM domain
MLVFSQWQRQGNARDVPWSSIAPTTAEWVSTGAKLLRYSNPRLSVFGNFYGDLRNNESGRLSLDSPLFPKHLYFYNAFPRITPQGDIFADQLWVDKEWTLGNIKAGDTLDTSFRLPKFFGQLKAMEDRVAATEDCKRCHWRDLCGGGSAGHTFAEFGHMNSRDLFCDSRIWWFEKYVHHQAERCLRQPVQADFSKSMRIRPEDKSALPPIHPKASQETTTH